MNREFYDNEREIDLSEQKTLHKREKKFVLARSGVFCAAAACFIAGLHGYHNSYIAAAILMMIFFRLVTLFDELKRRQKFLTSRLRVLNSYIVRERGTWRNRSVKGENYLSDERPQDVDLHIFGKGSIFQYICAARTKRGRDRLAAALSPVPQNPTAGSCGTFKTSAPFVGLGSLCATHAGQSRHDRIDRCRRNSGKTFGKNFVPALFAVPAFRPVVRGGLSRLGE